MNWKLIIILAGVIVLAGAAGWYFFSGPPETLRVVAPVEFGTGADVNPSVQTTGGLAQDTQLQSPQSTLKVFKIASGPVAGAAVLQRGRPTTTLARFVLQQNGHVLELALDSPGAVSRAVSNTTIPGVARVLWSPDAGAALLQYLDGTIVKTLHLELPVATSSASTTRSAARVQFLPNGITGLALSPSGEQVAYLLNTTGGSAGYVAAADGSAGRELFSLPLSQLWLSWPASGTLLAQSKPASGVAGIAFSVSARNGTATPLLSGPGLTATANGDFSQVVYQTDNGADRFTFAHDAEMGEGRPLSFNPFPERCTWSNATSTLMYCAAPLSFAPAGWIDLWRQGAVTAGDSVFAFDVAAGHTTLVATPGGANGGTVADIVSIAVAPDDSYLLFITKNDRSLWGIRL